MTTLADDDMIGDSDIWLVQNTKERAEKCHVKAQGTDCESSSMTDAIIAAFSWDLERRLRIIHAWQLLNILNRFLLAVTILAPILFWHANGVTKRNAACRKKSFGCWSMKGVFGDVY